MRPINAEEAPLGLNDGEKTLFFFPRSWINSSITDFSVKIMWYFQDVNQTQSTVFPLRKSFQDGFISMVTRAFTVIIANRRLRRHATGRYAGKASLLDGIFGGMMIGSLVKIRSTHNFRMTRSPFDDLSNALCPREPVRPDKPIKVLLQLCEICHVRPKYQFM